jgi:chlorobactene glucosyltransferase
VISLVALLSSLVAAGMFTVIAIRAQRRYRQLPELPNIDTPDTLPSVTVIVPARNESANIRRIVHSLVAMNYPTESGGFRVLIVDDHSTDDTATLARSGGADVIRLEAEPPVGWTGKCNACEQGACQSNTEWLLFTDADTIHTPDSLRQAVAYAENHHLDALSLLLRQECVGVWDRALLPLAYQQFFAVLRLDKPVFNGQYILIRRAVYERSGGFGAVRGRVMEDVAMAESLTSQGYRTALLNGEQAASVQMYADFRSLWRGMTKTAFAAARDRGAAGLLLGGVTLIGTSLLLLIVYGFFSAQWGIAIGGLSVAGWNGWLLLPWLRRFGVRPAVGYALLNLPALSLLLLIGAVSTMHVVFGRGVQWKGRTIIEQR